MQTLDEAITEMRTLKRPSDKLRELSNNNELEFVFPMVDQFIGLEQNPIYHPEGDLFDHVCNMLDMAATDNYSNYDPFTVILGIIYHDVGKIRCTKIRDKHGVPTITSYSHDAIGSDMWLDEIRFTGSLQQSTILTNEIILHVFHGIKHHMRVKRIDEMRTKKQEYFRKNRYFMFIKIIERYDNESRTMTFGGDE